MQDHFSDILSVDQASALLQLNPQTVRRMLVRGQLPGRKLGNTWRLSRNQLLEFVENRNFAYDQTPTNG